VVEKDKCKMLKVALLSAQMFIFSSYVIFACYASYHVKFISVFFY